jgi:hypothetical protein
MGALRRLRGLDDVYAQQEGMEGFRGIYGGVRGWI